MTGLLEVAVWAQKNKIFRGRDTCALIILEFAKDHNQARKWLKFIHRDGEWIRKREYRQPSNHNKDAEPIFAEKFSAVIERYITTMLAGLDALPRDEYVPEKEAFIRDLLKVAPGDERIHSRNGETLYENKWVLQETATAARHRIELKEKAARIVEKAPHPKRDSPTAEDRKLQVKWKGTWQGHQWRGLGTVEPKEVSHAVRMADAAFPLLEMTFGISFREPRSGATFYLLNTKAEAKTALTAHPAFGERERDYYLRLSSAWVPGEDRFFQFSDSPGLRLDGSMRQVIGLLLTRRFNVSHKQGWVWEGFGLYLDYLLLGTRYTTFVTPEYTTTKDLDAKLLARRMSSSGSDWVAIAKEYAKGGQAPDLIPMMKKGVTKLTQIDLLFSYALASYMLEGWPDKVQLFLNIYGGSDAVEHAVKTAYGISWESMEKRFFRWLDEY